MISRAEQVKCDAKSKKPVYETTTIQYDIFGNLKQYGKVAYKIDPLNKRLSRSVNGIITNMYAYNPEGQMIAELDSTGNLLKYFIYGSKNHVPDYFVDNTNTKFKIITDHLGSVRFVLNSQSGEVKEKMNHDEFGKVLTDSNPNFIPFGFAGGIYDSETKLTRFGVRDYDARIGRWTSKDPISFNGGDTNLYGYVIQDPINHIDPPGTGPIIGGACFILDVGYNMGQGVVDFYNFTQQASIYEQQIRNIQNQMENTNSCDPNMNRLQNQITSLEMQKNVALAQASNALFGGIGATAAGALVCGGLLKLPGY